jgi:uncharacterized protein YqjF (DUF2071 family)
MTDEGWSVPNTRLFFDIPYLDDLQKRGDPGAAVQQEAKRRQQEAAGVSVAENTNSGSPTIASAEKP